MNGKARFEMRQDCSYATAACPKPNGMLPTIERDQRVFVTHYLAHRRAPRPQPNGLPYSPLQRIPAGWEGRYICLDNRWDVYDAETDAATPRDIHLVKDPSGRARRVLLEDITPVIEPAQERTS